jgi:hypothetical protein
MKLFLCVLLLVVLPIKTVDAYASTVVVNYQRSTPHLHGYCDDEELRGISEDIHFEKHEMIITKQISCDQFSKFIVLNGPYIEYRKLQAALETGTSDFQRTLKVLIESYSGAKVDEEDFSLLA